MERKKLRQFLKEYMDGTISKAQLDELLDYVSMGTDPSLDELLDELLAETAVDPNLPVDADALYERITTHPRFARRPMTPKRVHWWWAGAAAMLLVASGLFLIKGRDGHIGGEGSVATTTVERTVTTSPSDRLLLRLADGRTIDLDNMADGRLMAEEGVHITLDGNALHYAGDVGDDGEEAMHTIITPKGRQYQLVLPDGSKIWLNAATTLTYPAKFAEGKREVSVDGEAYFEVKRAADWPFIVHAGDQDVEVLGTTFNVSAYNDDHASRTTLVTGSVSVRHAQTDQVILKPGQQALVAGGRSGLRVTTVDVEEAISWKDNLFVFDNEEIQEVMRKVSRWYDVEVEYLDGMAGKRIGGSIPRFDHIDNLMDALAATGLLRYQMKGGVVVIMK